MDAAVLGDRLPEVTQKPFLGPGSLSLHCRHWESSKVLAGLAFLEMLSQYPQSAFYGVLRGSPEGQQQFATQTLRVLLLGLELRVVLYLNQRKGQNEKLRPFALKLPFAKLSKNGKICFESWLATCPPAITGFSGLRPETGQKKKENMGFRRPPLENREQRAEKWENGRKTLFWGTFRLIFLFFGFFFPISPKFSCFFPSEIGMGRSFALAARSFLLTVGLCCLR